ncbi:competence/damage-inducible protein A [Fusibacter bizertensis]
MKAGILSIGTELLMGKTVNTNATYLSKEMAELGIGVYYHYTIGDNPGRIKKALNDLLNTCDIIVTTGGLGPTLDDITKEIIADTLNLKMILDERSLSIIKERFVMFNRAMPESNVRQAYFPEGSIILDNEKGTAPACIIEIKERNKCIVVLPGPPREMSYLYETYVKAYLKMKNVTKMHSVYLSVYDYGESAVEEKLLDLIAEQTNPTVATYAGDGKVLLRVTASGEDEQNNIDAVNHFVRTIKERIGNYIVSEKGDDIDKAVFDLLIEKGLKIALVESCTGGKLTSALIKHSGASEVVDCGLITYSNDAKVREVNVSRDTLQMFGAVSHQTCYEMVKGLVAKTGADIGISVTGIAGPCGGTTEKPVGLVYIGISIGGEIYTFENKFSGDRDLIQNRTVYKALKILYDYLSKM